MCVLNINQQIAVLKQDISFLKNTLRYEDISCDDQVTIEMLLQSKETELTALTAQHAILTNCDHADSLLA